MIETAIEQKINHLTNEELDQTINSQVHYKREFDDDAIIIVLSCGSKLLKFKIYDIEDPELINTSTWLQNIRNLSKIPGETSLLYTQVNKLCQLLANKNKTVRYTLTSAVPKLQSWAESKGSEIFNWDDVKETRFEEISGSVKTYIKFFYKQAL